MLKNLDKILNLVCGRNLNIVIIETSRYKVTNGFGHGLRTPNEGINQRYLKNWADVADKICCRHT